MKEIHLPSLHVLRLGAPEDLLVIHGAGFALAFLRHHTILADVELGAILGMRIRGMRQDPARRSSDVAVRTDETVVQDVAFHVLAQASGVHRPDAA